MRIPAKRIVPFGLVGLLLCVPTWAADNIADDAAAALSKHLGNTPALVVVACQTADDAAAVARLAEQTPWTLLCRGPQSPGLDAVRDWAGNKGLLGSRVFVAAGQGPSLWLADDLADAVYVAPGAASPPSQSEMLRVLRPGGVALAGGKTTVKGAARGVDQWRHPYHGPDNNVVSADRVARLPGELRFQAQPVFAAMPNQSLFAGGRIFFFTGHIAFHQREEALLNTLTVLNAYNGLRLWSRPLDPNYVVHNVAKLATDDEVIFTEGPTLWRLDAATGAVRGKIAPPAEATAAGDTDWKWLAQERDTLWAALGPPDARVAPHRQKRQMGHWPWDVADAQYKGLVDNFGPARTLVAYRWPEMSPRWSVREPEAFDARALCLSGGRILQLSPGEYMAARDAATGATLWRHTPADAKPLFDAIGAAVKRQGWGLGWATYCCVRASDGVACIAGPPFRKTIGIGLEKGDLLWSLPAESPHPFFFQDALYMVPRVGGPKTIGGRFDPRTGKLLDPLALGVIGSCTRLTVTPNQFFYRPGGGEGRTVYVDLANQKLSDYEGIVRPGCFDGVVPANGRLYWMPLACDCWQVHGTFAMAPRQPIPPTALALAATSSWSAPSAATPAAADDWPQLRANSAGTATVDVRIPRKVRTAWTHTLRGAGLTAPIAAAGKVFIGGNDGAVRAFDAADGKPLWTIHSQAAVVAPPAYRNGRVVFGSCDGSLYCADAADGRLLGRVELAPAQRFVHIMGRLVSTWPLGGGVVLGQGDVVYAAAGSTAADGAVVAAVDIANGNVRWKQTYTLDTQPAKLCFGVQGNLLVNGNTLFVNGGAPIGVVAIDTDTGRNARVAARLGAGMEMFLEADGSPFASGPELYCSEAARTTIFNRHQGRVFFHSAGRHFALIHGRVVAAADTKPLEQLVAAINRDTKSSGNVPDPMRLRLDSAVLWSTKTADVCGMAVAADGLVLLHRDCVEAVDAAGKSLWKIPLPAPPVRWGIALTGRHCAVTLANDTVLCLAPAE